jgi:hypothetical protein
MHNIGVLLGKQTEPHKLPFKDVLRVADLLADRMKVLSDSLIYPQNPKFDTKRVKEIRTALKAVSKTPNGSITRETLDQWITELCGFRDELAAWCEGLLTFRHEGQQGKASGEHSELPLDEVIPF